MKNSSSPNAGPVAWFLDRSGLGAVLDFQTKFAGKLLPANLSWLYTTGALALFFFALQFLTGCLLLTIYVPHEDHAFKSVQTIQHTAELGWLVRQMHSWGASFVIIVLLLHVLKVLWFGSYKRPREFTWFVGVVLLNVALGFCFSGYLLPWNQLSFWATRVALEAVDSIPVIGMTLKEFICGENAIPGLNPGDAARSPSVSGATIGRFFSLHVIVLPLTLIAFIGYHLFLITFKGASPKSTVGEEFDLGHRESLRLHGAETFFPRQVYRDLIACCIGFAALVTVATFWPWEVGEPASLNTPPGIKPEWYFLPMYQLVKYFDNKLWAIVVMNLGAGAFFLLPLLDRGGERKMLKKPILFWLGPVFLLGLLSILAYQSGAISEWIGEQSLSAPALVGIGLAATLAIVVLSTGVFSVSYKRPLFASVAMIALLIAFGLGFLGYASERTLNLPLFGKYHFDTYGVPTAVDDSAGAGAKDGAGAEDGGSPTPAGDADGDSEDGDSEDGDAENDATPPSDDDEETASAPDGNAADANTTLAAVDVAPKPVPGGTCVDCHESQHEEWENSVHAGAGVTCVDCHGGNDQPPPDPLPAFLAKPPIESIIYPQPEKEEEDEEDEDADESEDENGDDSDSEEDETDSDEDTDDEDTDDEDAAPVEPVITYIDPCEVLDEIDISEWGKYAYAHIGIDRDDEGCPRAPTSSRSGNFEVRDFCGKCHGMEKQYFNGELHQGERPRKTCVKCHSNHEVQAVDATLYESYDDPEDARTSPFHEIRDLLARVDNRAAELHPRDESVVHAELEKAEPALRLLEALDHEAYPTAAFKAKLDKLTTEAKGLHARVHTLDPAIVRGNDSDRGADAILADLDALSAEMDKAIHAPDDRWVFVAGVWGAALLASLLLGLKLRTYPSARAGEVVAPDDLVPEAKKGADVSEAFNADSGSEDDDPDSAARAAIAAREAESKARDGDERGALLYPMESDETSEGKEDEEA